MRSDPSKLLTLTQLVEGLDADHILPDGFMELWISVFAVASERGARMTSPGTTEEVLATLKDFQRLTAEWVFSRMFDVDDPAERFLVADEVGLGKTHVAKGVVAQVLDHLDNIGDRRHDVVYICSNGAIARQNLRKLVPRNVKPLDAVERLTMLPLAQFDEGEGSEAN